MSFLPMIAADPGPGDTEERMLANDDLLAQPKIDGHHLAVFLPGDGQMLGFGRDGQRVIPPPAVAGALAAYRGDSLILDGELLPWAGPDATFYPFDLVMAAGLSPRAGFATRIRRLGDLWPTLDFGPRVQLVPTARGRAAKEAMRDVLKATGGEGLVFKHAGRPYTYGKRHHGVATRLKWHNDVDAVVVEVGVDGKDNIAVAVYDDNGTEVRIAEVTRLAGDKDRIKVGDLVVVKYASASPNHRLIHPTLPRIRTDRGPGYVPRLSQLVYGDKYAFTALGS